LGEWKAHDDKILAACVTIWEKRRLFITGAGANDTSLAFWDASGNDEDSEPMYHISNGKGTYYFRASIADRVADKMIQTLGELVAFRTVSSRPQYARDSYQAATFLRKLCSQFGAETLLLNTGTERNPIVFARFSGNLKESQRGTVLFYGHYDVINAENHRKWDTDPFTLSPINSYLYGRGASDNKGPIIAALYATGDLSKVNQLPHNVIFLIEGEEESGSRGFEETVQNNKELFGNVDWILLSNSYWLDDHIPCLTYGLRGVIRITLQIDSDHPDLHSGIDGSSMLDEPVKDLVLLLGSLVGPGGKIHIPHFYQSILPVTKSESARYEAISTALHECHPEIEDTELFTESLLRRWTLPALTIHHIDASGPRNSTTISRTAKADISIRLVPNQDARKTTSDLIFYLHNQFQSLGSKNHLDIKLNHFADPWLGDPENEIFQTLEEAVKAAWAPTPPLKRRNYPLHPPSSPTTTTSTPPAPLKSKSKVPTSSTLADASCSSSPAKARDISAAHTPLYIREGGSIPAIRFLEKEFGAPAAQFPCGQASDHAHLDNERLRVENLYKGREVFRRVFRELPARK
jgi:di- and tripeptidase